MQNEQSNARKREQFDVALDRVVELFQGASEVILISHVNPDPDAVGSQLGLALCLKAMGIRTTLFNESEIPPSLQFLPGSESLKRDLVENAAVLEHEGCVTVVLDCGDQKRVGDIFLPALSSARTLVNIDHHISNTYFGVVSLVDPAASSTAEIVYRIVQHGKFPVTPAAATCLFTGISGDTGSFRYSSTGAETLRAAAHLVELGASPSLIATALYGSVKKSTLRLQAAVLSSASFLFQEQVAWGVATQDLYSATGAGPDDAEGLIERLRDIEGVKVAVLSKWDGSLWRVSLRSTSERYNVSQLASRFGGGGHTMAAAFRWRDSLEALQDKLKTSLSELFE